MKIKYWHQKREQNINYKHNFGCGKEGASVSFVGSDEHIEEFVLFANKKENGFAVIRILGKDMKPTGIMTMMSVLQKANIDLEQLKPLLQLLEK